MYSDGFNPRIMKLCAWTGVFFCILWPFAAGIVTDGMYILPPSAADAATKTVADYTSNIVPVRVATTLLIFASMFYTTWGMAVSMLTKNREGRWPILFYIQVISLACSVVVVMLIGYFWGAASWRAGETAPEVTQALNDIGWLGVLYTGAPFAVYMVALALQTLTDRSEKPVYPRWSAFFNFFVTVFMFEASLILFFKTGPFSQNGLLVFYVPMIVFFSWIMVFSFLALRAIKNEVAERQRRGAEEVAPLSDDDVRRQLAFLEAEVSALRAERKQHSTTA
jgi:hypothetical protein